MARAASTYRAARRNDARAAGQLGLWARGPWAGKHLRGNWHYFRAELLDGNREGARLRKLRRDRGVGRPVEIRVVAETSFSARARRVLGL